MSHAEVLVPKMTLDEFLAWEETQEERHEYLDGVIRAMSGGSLDHNQIVANITKVTGVQLENTPCRSLTSSQRVQSESFRSYFYPDLLIVCEEPKLGRGDSILNPLVIFEVLSPSTEKYDRYEKFRRYQTIKTLQEYFLIRQDTAIVEAYRRMKSKTWTTTAYNVYVGLDTVLTVESAGISFPLRAIYDRVTLEDAEPRKEEGDI